MKLKFITHLLQLLTNNKNSEKYYTFALKKGNKGRRLNEKVTKHANQP